MHRIFTIMVLCLLALVPLAGCQTSQQALDKVRAIDVPVPLSVYKIEIVQGNFVSSEQVAALRTGMPKAQVKNILGTPLLTDVFHADRWDYVFTITKDAKTSIAKRLTVYFKDDALDRFEGDTMPSETEFVSALTSGRKISKVPPLEATDKQLAEFARRENPVVQEASAATPPSVFTNTDKTYPSLESK